MPARKPRIGVLIHGSLRKQLFSVEDEARLDALGSVTWCDHEQPMTDAKGAAMLADCDVAVSSWGTPRPTAEVLAAAPKLKLWVHAAGSVKSFFGPHLDGRKLVIASCAPAIAENVAEFTTALLVIGLKRALPAAQHLRSGGKMQKPANIRTLSSSVVGVIGASQVGRRVVRNVQAAGARVMLYDPFVKPAEAETLKVELTSNLLALCSGSEAVTLHTPPLPTTEKMMSARQFRAMRDDAVFVNTSRGMCVDEAALISELQKGRLFAFLDVTYPEPSAPDNPLRTLSNCVLTPHIAGGPDIKIGRQAVDDIDAFLHGKPPLMPVTAEMLSRLA